MTPIEFLAISRLLNDNEKKKVRNQIAPGDYSVNFNVHIEGEIKVEEDVEKRSTISVPWTEAYALFRLVSIAGIDDLISQVESGSPITKSDLESVKKAGFLSESVMIETMKEAWEIRQESKSEGSIMSRVPEVKNAVEKVKEAIAGSLGLMSQKGRVIAKLKSFPVSSQSSTSAVEVANSVSPPKKKVCDGRL